MLNRFKPVLFRYPLRLALLALGSTALMSCVSTDVPPIEAQAAPDDATDEGGIWYVTDKVEKDLQTSAIVERDPALNDYVSTVACRVTGPEYCKDLRVYIVKQPYFNASMAPNGMMQVWTGLLLRAENEDQLAYVLGHEFAHYRQRHSLKQWRQAKNMSNASLIFSVGAAAAGAGAAGVLGQAAALARLYGFSREAERESDDLGFDFFVAAGYAPGEAARTWEYLIAEAAESSSRRKRKSVARASVFATHPVTTERVENLQAKAAALPAGTPRREAFLAVTKPFLQQWLEQDLTLRDFGSSLFLTNTLIEDGDALGVLYFHRAEIYRLRRADGDNDLALADYQTASQYDDAPPENWRQMGDALAKAGKTDEAKTAWATYLEKAPDAPDRLLIQSYLDPDGA